MFRNILASASADKLVKIWDVATETCSMTLENHTDKARLNLYIILQCPYLLQLIIVYIYHHQSFCWKPKSTHANLQPTHTTR